MPPLCCINLLRVRNIVISFRLTMILHQRNFGYNHKDVQANASVRAAFVHALGDVFQSISVLISALIIYFKVSVFSNQWFSGCSSIKTKPQIPPMLAACVHSLKPFYKVKANKSWNHSLSWIPKSCLCFICWALSLPRKTLSIWC